MNQHSSLLSAIVTVGSCRGRGQRVLDALCAQSVAESIEIIVVDLAAENSPRLQTASQVRTKYIPRPKNEPYARARGEGKRCGMFPIGISVCSPGSKFDDCSVKHGLAGGKSSFPALPSEHTARLPAWARAAVPVYHALKDYPLTKWLVYLFGPLFHVICIKK